MCLRRCECRFEFFDFGQLDLDLDSQGRSFFLDGLALVSEFVGRGCRCDGGDPGQSKDRRDQDSDPSLWGCRRVEFGCRGGPQHSLGEYRWLFSSSPLSVRPIGRCEPLAQSCEEQR